MKYTIVIKDKSGAQIKEHYNKKSAADQREKELAKMGHFKEIKCFWIWADNRPEERRRIDF